MSKHDTTGDTTIPSWAEHNLHQRIKAKEKAPTKDITSIDEQIDKALEELVFCGRDTVGVTDEAVLARNAIKTLISDQVAKARIQTLTDVDNLNLLNDSDEWHKFYTSELATLNGVKK